jgi:hypothetical protein
LFEPGEFSAMKNFDLLLNFCILFRAKNQRKTKKNGQGLLTPFMPGSAGGNQNFIFLYPMTFCITSGGKFWYPECSEILSDEI